jgi:uroporphyrinogen-III decarboxylase
MVGEPGEVYRQRLKRVEDAISLRTPDRVPFFPLTQLMPRKYMGITAEKAFYSTRDWLEANKRSIIDLEPDIYWPASAVYPGRALEAAKISQVKWPGAGGLAEDSGIQFVEAEYMKADEYDLFLDDPTDYYIRTYLPRLFKSCESLKELPPVKALFYGGYRAIFSSAALAEPAIVEAIEALYRTALESKAFVQEIAAFNREMTELGFPPAFGGGIAGAPFDVLSDVHRGMRGSMLDMYRQPDKLIAAMERVTPLLIQDALLAAKRSGHMRIFMPLHRGADGFMSDDQFRKFYWPGLRRVLLALIDAGLTPCPLFEGPYASRLKYLGELPKGKIMAMFDDTDIRKVKEVVGDTVCICGNMPVSVLQFGTPQEVRELTKQQIDAAAKGGGFMMSCRGVLDEARPELVKVWAEATREYGRYW